MSVDLSICLSIYLDIFTYLFPDLKYLLKKLHYTKQNDKRVWNNHQFRVPQVSSGVQPDRHGGQTAQENHIQQKVHSKQPPAELFPATEKQSDERFLLTCSVVSRPHPFAILSVNPLDEPYKAWDTFSCRFYTDFILYIRYACKMLLTHYSKNPRIRT